MIDKKMKNIIIIALAFVLAGFFPGYFYYASHINNRTVTVKGLAEMDVKADLAFWKIKFKTTGNDLFAAQNKLNKDLNLITDFLKEQGFSDAEISIERINTNDLMTELTTGEITSLITYGIQILSSLMMLAMILVMSTMARTSGERIVEVLKEEPDIKNPKKPIEKVESGASDTFLKPFS